MSELKVIIAAKKKTNDAFKGVDGVWYNLDPKAVPILEKLNKDDEIVLTIEGTGYKSKVVGIVKVGGIQTSSTPTETKTTTGFKCSVCGKELKDGKYQKCYDCNKIKTESPVKETKEEPKSNPAVKAPETANSGKSTYTPDKDKNSDYIIGVRIGCAFRVAGEAVSGNFPNTKPEELAQAIVIIAKRVLEAMNQIQ